MYREDLFQAMKYLGSSKITIIPKRWLRQKTKTGPDAPLNCSKTVLLSFRDFISLHILTGI